MGEVTSLPLALSVLYETHKLRARVPEREREGGERISQTEAETEREIRRGAVGLMVRGQETEGDTLGGCSCFPFATYERLREVTIDWQCLWSH
ncbi:hypothetical protein ATANTOWER_010727 [Ataeniobius toweri]|uniref:Uncharacterized protein n=1 Tax=Ataeniobius toweri TaxID=208326 RepID=A0ABU7CES9_9TELE|nr:hypothetical protein [Ataeniobius toweri]